jgi:hypothetical protein
MCDVGIFSSYAVKWLGMATFFSISQGGGCYVQDCVV